MWIKTAGGLTIAATLMLGTWTGLRAQPVELAPDRPDTYTVQRGDTLWDISGRFLVKPWRWPEIWQINPQIENPHLIYPGDIVRLVFQAGQPVITLERGAGSGVQDPDLAERGSAPIRTPVGPREVKLSAQVRAYAREKSIPTIPLERVAKFLKRTLLVTPGEFLEQPYVVAADEQGRLNFSSKGDLIYVRGVQDTAIQTYSIYRKSNEYQATAEPGREPELLGYELLYIGEAMVRDQGDPVIARVTKSLQEIRPGDRLYALGADENFTSTPSFMPHPPPVETSGKILSVVPDSGYSLYRSVVVIDLGAEDDVDQGTVLAIYGDPKEVGDAVSTEVKRHATRKERLRFRYEDENPVDEMLSVVGNDIRDLKQKFDESGLGQYLGPSQSQPETVQLPGERIGTLLLFRSFATLSYALLMATEAIIRVNSVLRNP